MPAPKYFFDDLKDKMIRHAYTSPDVGRRNGPIKALARRLDIPTYALLRRARKLGLNPRVARYGKAWTDAELAIVRQHAERTAETISRRLAKAGFIRTPNAVSICLKRQLGLSRKEARMEAGMYNLTDAARLLGCDEKLLSRMIGCGDLPAKRVDGRPDGRASYYLVREKDLRKMLIQHTAHFNFGRIDKYWLVDLLTGQSIAKGGREAA